MEDDEFDYSIDETDQEAIDQYVRRELVEYYTLVECGRLLRAIHNVLGGPFSDESLNYKVESRKAAVLERILLAGYAVSAEMRKEVAAVAFTRLLEDHKDSFILQTYGPVHWDVLNRLSPVSGALLAQAGEAGKTLMARVSVEAGLRGYRQAQEVYAPRLEALQDKLVDLEGRFRRLDPLVQLASVSGSEIKQ